MIRLRKEILVATLATLGLTFLLAPIIIIIVMSFSSSEFLSFPPPGFSSRWYKGFFESPAWRNALWTSLKVGSLAMLLSVLIGLPASLALVRGQFRSKDAWYALILSPVIVPAIITAIA